ncbi:MAG: CPBP family intramembrane metalloprotease [Labilithrix sp.]|nr:CPBP family intramembrane metalloprotease [Labilithrix sp.]MCW5834728.1 CPBP family intramembrane metalloprotease [Labilithrix sp.]
MSLLGPGRLPPAKELTGLAGFVEDYKALLPIPALAAILVLVWLFFRDTWRELDEDSLRLRAEVHAKGRMDHRPFIALVLVALILTMQEYYGGRQYFESTISPLLARLDAKHPGMQFAKYDDLYGFSWWAGTRIFGYVLPFPLWKLFFPKDSLLDLGLRTKGFFDHAWIYGLFLAFVLPAMLVVAKSPDFGTYYPFYKQSSRSWFDFLVWEAMYFAQFFALEMFFRGFWLGALRRSFGSGAIFVMAVPYCMIHYGKPYLEACGAIIAGIALGSLSMKTKSIYQGFLVHVTVAALMDWLALRNRKATPLHVWASDLPAGAEAWLREQEQREALAQVVERTAAVVFAVLFVFMIVMIVRSRRRRLERFWTFPSKKS